MTTTRPRYVDLQNATLPAEGGVLLSLEPEWPSGRTPVEEAGLAIASVGHQPGNMYCHFLPVALSGLGLEEATSPCFVVVVFCKT